MSSDEIRVYASEEMRAIDQEANRVAAYSQQLPDLPMTAQERQPILEGIEGVIDRLQRLHDRCRDRFPEAEADGRTDPFLAYLRSLISRWHVVWEGWNIPGK